MHLFVFFRNLIENMVFKRKLLIKDDTEIEVKKAKILANLIHEHCMNGDAIKAIHLLENEKFDTEIVQEISKNETIYVVSRLGNVTVMNELIKIGIDINQLNSEGKSPMHIACENRHIEIVEKLLENGADPNLKCTTIAKSSPLHYVVESLYVKEEGDEVIKNIISIIKCLLKYGANVNAENSIGHSVLFAAVTRDGTEVVKELLKNGANVHTKHNPLHEAAAGYDLAEIIQELLTYNADVNCKTNYWPKYTPLHIATQEGHFEAVCTLLVGGANVNAMSMDKKNATALHIASEKGYLDILQELLRFGAKTDFPEMEIGSPIHKATQIGYLDVVQELLKHGAQVDVTDDEGGTALHIAALMEDSDIFKELLKNGANVNAKILENQSVLNMVIKKHYFFYQESLEIIRLLLEDESIDLNVRNEDNLTALEKALEFKQMEIARMIAKKIHIQFIP